MFKKADKIIISFMWLLITSILLIVLMSLIISPIYYNTSSDRYMSKCYIKKDSLYYCDSEIYRYPPIKKVYYIRDNISTVFVEFNDNGMDNSCFTLDNGFEGEFPLFKKVLPENDYEPFKTTVYFKELPVGEIVLSR